jgi:hypothetical protein
MSTDNLQPYKMQLPEQKPGQASSLLLCEGPEVDPLEAGQWYSPDAVRTILADARAHYEAQLRQLGGLAQPDAWEANYRATSELRAKLAAAEGRARAESMPTPIDMILQCPACLQQHIDEPGPGWDNPPHRSHKCHHCGFIWRPADVPTNGVAAIKTRGKSDHVMFDGPADALERLRLEQELKNPPKLDWDGERP